MITLGKEKRFIYVRASIRSCLHPFLHKYPSFMHPSLSSYIRPFIHPCNDPYSGWVTESKVVEFEEGLSKGFQTHPKALRGAQGDKFKLAIEEAKKALETKQSTPVSNTGRILLIYLKEKNKRTIRP